MKRLLLILVCAVLAFPPGASAQDQNYVPTPVTVSREKVKLNGKLYLSHVVLERQTLFSISKAYGVDVEEIYRANPSLLDNGLQKNAIILIPYREGAEEDTSGYTEHTVRWFEDIDDIAKKYGVSAKDIMEFNNLKSRKLTTRQVLKIPLGPVTASATSAVAAAEKPAETTEKPSVTSPATTPDTTPVEPVVEKVETVVEQPVQTGVEKVETIVEQPVQTVVEKPETEVTEQRETIVETVQTEEEPLDGQIFTGKNPVEMALLLPLNAGGKVSEVNMDFYSGVLLALKDLDAQGIRTKINVYDLTAGIPTREALVRNDFVLGPVASRDLEFVLQRVEGAVPVISPLDQKAAALAGNYENFIQAPSSADNQYFDLGEWLAAEAGPGERIILVTEKGAKSTTASVAIRNSLAQNNLTYEILNYAIVEGRGIPAILTSKMEKGTTNRIVVASESEAFIGDVMRNLGIVQGKGYDLVMYAPSKVRTFDTIDGSTYHKALLHLSTSYYVDYSSADVDRFVRAYRALYNTEPSQFAFQGYDTARYFVSRCAKYGIFWPRMLSEETVRGLHTDFRFSRNRNGNYLNTAVRRVVYLPDYTTSLDR